MWSVLQAMNEDFVDCVDCVMLVVLIVRLDAERCQRDATERKSD